MAQPVIETECIAYYDFEITLITGIARIKGSDNEQKLKDNINEVWGINKSSSNKGEQQNSSRHD